MTAYQAGIRHSTGEIGRKLRFCGLCVRVQGGPRQLHILTPLFLHIMAPAWVTQRVGLQIALPDSYHESASVPDLILDHLDEEVCLRER